MRHIVIIDSVLQQTVLAQFLPHIIGHAAFRTDKVKSIAGHFRHRDAVPQILHLVEPPRPLVGGEKLFQHFDLAVQIINDFVVNDKGEDLPQIIPLKTKFLKHLLRQAPHK